MIYGYALVSPEPLEFVPGNWRANQPLLAVPLLRTCKQINDEGSEFYYGRNEWRFESQGGHILALRFLGQIGPQQAKWLRRLTICTPFMGDQIYHYSSYYYIGFGTRSKTHRRVYYLVHRCGKGPTWGGLFKKFIRLLEQLRDLKELTLVLPNDWQFQRHLDDADETAWEDFALDLNHEVVWTTLLNFTRARPLVSITTVRPVYSQSEMDDDHCRHKQHLKNLRYKLGIWDHRVAWIPDCGDWHVEGRMEEDPESYMEYLRILFGEEG